MARVDITTAGHTISVDSADSLDEVAAKALDLWQRTRDPRIDRAYGPVGFHTERPDGPAYVGGHDVDLSHPESTKGRDGL